MKTASEISATLPHFTGTESYHAHGFFGVRLKLTDGAAYLREAADCFWLFDIIVSVARKLRAKDSFHVIRLKVDKENPHRKHDAVFTADDGNGNIHYRQEIAYTDFPLSEVTLYFQDDVVMLPSEY